jgi:4-hydroxy-tetrahydrodipicolinate synthase
MKPFQASEIRGNWATLLLPIRPDESIDYELLAEEIAYFAQARVSGIYSNGTAGEFYTQTETEFDRVNHVLAESCERLRVPFQIGASHMSPQLSLARVQRSRALKPSAFQIILPDWFPPTLDEICRFLDVMVEVANPVPLVIYNPPHAKVKLGPPEWSTIAARFPGVVGIKVFGGDDGWYEAMQPVFKRLSVFIPGHTLANGLRRGAHGAYSNMASLSPAGAQAWYDLCRINLPEGLKLQQKITHFFSAHVAPLITDRKFPNVAADKLLAVAGGWLPGLTQKVRWPYATVHDDDIARVGAAARSALPEFFS